MAAARLAFGVAQASCYPVLNKVSKNWFPLGMRATVQGLIATFCGRAGGAASFVLFGTVLLGWLRLTWQQAVGVFAAIGVACGAAFLLLFRNTPREHPWANAAEADLVTAGDPAAAVATRARLRWGALARSRSAWLLFTRALLSNLADVVYVYWVPLYLRQFKGLEPSASGWLAALPLLGGAFGGVTSGTLQSLVYRRTGSRRLARCGVGGGGKLAAAGLVLSILVLDDPLAICAALLVVKFFCDMEQPAEWGTVSDIAGASAATVFACVNTAGSLGGFLAGPLTGWVLTSYSDGGTPSAVGWNAVFLIIAAEYLLAAACWLLIDPTRPIEPTPGT
jgi:sugar phosphate permease